MPDRVSDDDIVALIVPLQAVSTGMSKVVTGRPMVVRLMLLQAVKYTEKARPSQVATALGMHQSQATRQIQALQDEGLLVATGDPDDGRSRILALTGAGEAEVDRLVAYGLARWRTFVDGWDPVEVRELGRLLSKLQDSIAESKRSRGGNP